LAHALACRGCATWLDWFNQGGLFVFVWILHKD
jgi:hypothetical protein